MLFFNYISCRYKSYLERKNEPKTVESKNFIITNDLTRTTVFCKHCYGSAKVTCNRDSIYIARYSHSYSRGTCFYNLYRSRARYYCSNCNISENIDSGQHDCLETHIECGAGSIRICGIY